MFLKIFTSVTNHINDILNNREQAISIWIFLIVVLGTLSSKIRNSILDVIEAFFAKKLVQIYCAMLIYISFIILMLYTTNHWGIKNLADTIKWCALVAFVMLFNFEKAKQPNYFKFALVSNLKILVIIEFIINLYVFSLPVELILVPFLAILGAMTAIAESDNQYEPAQRLLNLIMIFIGCIFLVYSSYNVITDFHNFATVKTLESFYLPIVLSILFSPFVYLVALYSNYENFFIRISFFVEDPVVLKYAKIKTILKMNINLWELEEWSKYVNSNWRFKEKQEIDDAILVFSNRNRKK